MSLACWRSKRGQGRARAGPGQREAGLSVVGPWDSPPSVQGALLDGEPSVPQVRAPCNPRCPSFTVNPVFDPAEDSKGTSTRGARPSVSGTRQSPPTRRLRVFWPSRG
ncbi:Hypothetical predicted protein [Marmota monax]|uniref:Uncharacterized protein n=1 Tax=Marmota monax TaxID=9995 RepID=A0A5E4A606_MARMO|nr:hypothetical protein GHT09_000540 [Marmota monax]VTJ52121.1 Hypothetical predicted protein [Marmota monax]